MPSPASPPEKIALVSCMRNEGVFVLEWLAYHQTLGFDEIIVITNDCTDGSDVLLDQLAETGAVTHIRQTLQPDANPQDTGMDLALTHLRDAGFTWCLHIDSDEFLLIETGDGKLADLMPHVDQADVVAITWRNFGNNGLTTWKAGQSVLQGFTRSQGAPDPGNDKSKCLFRLDRFEAASDHSPCLPTVENPIIVNADGVELMLSGLSHRKVSRFRPHDVACSAKNARINHYAVKSDDVFLMKNMRGDGQGNQDHAKYYVGSRWYRLANCNDAEDTAILKHWDATEKRLSDMRAQPGISDAERLCQDWFGDRQADLLAHPQASYQHRRITKEIVLETNTKT